MISLTNSVWRFSPDNSFNGTLRILNLNCGGLSAKFDKLKLFLSSCNNNTSPISVITLQETHIRSSSSDTSMLENPDYSLIHDPARINRSGGV